MSKYLLRLGLDGHERGSLSQEKPRRSTAINTTEMRSVLLLVSESNLNEIPKASTPHGAIPA